MATQQDMLRRFLGVSTLSALAFTGISYTSNFHAQAQDADADVTAQAETEADATPAPQRAKLDEIIVTAQKRAEDIQDVPLSVTAIGGEDIKQKNMADLNDVSAYAPNLSVLATPTFNFIYMRGLGSGFNRGFEQSVAIIIDEVYMGRPSYLSNGLLDLAAVEVLRGPQGTLYGKNSAAGALHLRTQDPVPEWGLDADVLLGERNKYRVRAAFGGPLWNDDWSFRVAYMTEEQDGDIENTTIGRDERNLDNENARIKIRYEPSTTFNATLAIAGSTVDQQGSGTQLTKVRDRHLAAMQVYDPQTSDDVFDDKTHQNYPGFVERTNLDGNLRVNWELSSGYTLSSLTAYADMDDKVAFDADFSPIPFLILDEHEKFDQFSQEFRVTSPPGEVEFIAGLNYVKSNVDVQSDTIDFMELHEILAVTGEGERTICTTIPLELANLLGALLTTDLRLACQNSELDNPLFGTLGANATKVRQDLEGTPVIETSATRFDQTTESYAAFGQLTWHITDIWATTVGLRVGYEEKSIFYDHALINERTGIRGNGNPVDLQGNVNLNFTPGGALVFPVIQSGNTDFTESRSRDEFSVSPKVSTSVQWTDDLMTYLTFAQGYKSGGYNISALNPDQLEYDEESSVVLEGGFKSEWLEGAARLNVSIFYTKFRDLQISSFNGVSFVVENAADATIQGVEWEALLVPFWGMFLSATGAYTDATYDSFPNGPCSAEFQGDPPCDLAGAPLSSAPEWQHTLGATFDRQIFNLPFKTHLGVTGIYASDEFLTVDNDPVDVREAGWTVNGRTGIRGLDDNWSLMLYVDNILDREALAGNNDVPTFVGSHFGGRIPTTSYEVEFRYLF